MYTIFVFSYVCGPVCSLFYSFLFFFRFPFLLWQFFANDLPLFYGIYFSCVMCINSLSASRIWAKSRIGVDYGESYLVESFHPRTSQFVSENTKQSYERRSNVAKTKKKKPLNNVLKGSKKLRVASGKVM